MRRWSDRRPEQVLPLNSSDPDQQLDLGTLIAGRCAPVHREPLETHSIKRIRREDVRSRFGRYLDRAQQPTFHEPPTKLVQSSNKALA
jgi:hypothetical protein